MTTNDKNFQFRKNTQAYGDSLADNDKANQSIGAINMLKRDRFELLSAYLDGEVTAAERHQVDDWLANDPDIQRLYTRLLKLRQGLQTMPIPCNQKTADQTLEQVYQGMHRRSRRQAVVWAGGAIAAAFIGAVSIVLPNLQSTQIAGPNGNTPLEPLRVALNDPVVEIPHRGIVAPAQPERSLEFPQPQKDFN